MTRRAAPGGAGARGRGGDTAAGGRGLRRALALSVALHGLVALLIFEAFSPQWVTREARPALQASLRPAAMAPTPPSLPAATAAPSRPADAVSPAPTLARPARVQTHSPNSQTHELESRRAASVPSPLPLLAETGAMRVPLPAPLPAAAPAAAVLASPGVLPVAPVAAAVPAAPPGGISAASAAAPAGAALRALTEEGASGAAAEGLRGYRLALAMQARRFKRYPAQAQAAGWAGTVAVRLEVGPDGTARAAQVTASSGHPALDRAAVAMVDAAAARTPVPSSLHGREFAVMLPVVFDLLDERAAE